MKLRHGLSGIYLEIRKSGHTGFEKEYMLWLLALSTEIISRFLRFPAGHSRKSALGEKQSTGSARRSYDFSHRARGPAPFSSPDRAQSSPSLFRKRKRLHRVSGLTSRPHTPPGYGKPSTISSWSLTASAQICRRSCTPPRRQQLSLPRPLRSPFC